MESISAKSHRELQALLVGVDISVPHRGDKEDKRTTAHVECWSVCKFLATYGHTRFVRYPLTLEKRERPDYRMCSRDLVVGIEITEAVSQDMARIDAMRYAEDEVVCLDMSLFRPGTPRRSTQELRAILEGSRYSETEETVEDKNEFDTVQSRPMGPGWAGDGAERDWAEAIHKVIETKVASAKKLGFVRFDETWLLVYDNLSLPMLNVPRAAELLLPKLAPMWEQPVFEEVFIEYGKQFVRFSPDGFETRPLNDLWN